MLGDEAVCSLLLSFPSQRVCLALEYMGRVFEDLVAGVSGVCCRSQVMQGPDRIRRA